MSRSVYSPPLGLTIAGEAAAALGFTMDQITSRARHKSIVLARQAVIWALAERSNLSLAEIGAVVSRDHTTVIHAIRCENERRRDDVRNLTFPLGYRETRRIRARIDYELSCEVAA